MGQGARHGVIAGALSLALAGSTAAASCVRELRILGLSPVHYGTGELPDFAVLPRNLRGLHVRYLGSGLRGDSYRVTPERGEPYVLKQYDFINDIPELGRDAGLAIFRNNVRMWGELEALPRGNDRFQVQRFIAADERAGQITLGDARGQTLRTLLETVTPGFPLVAQRLIALHNERMSRLAQDLRNRGWTVARLADRPGGLETYEFRRDDLLFDPHPGNILVDAETLRMTIIDPE